MKPRLLLYLLRSMRPHQWVKNVFVLAPLVFALRAMDMADGVRALLAMLWFCLGSATIYLINDIVDREADAQHPEKRLRPIAAGQLPVRLAAIAASITGVLAVGGAAWMNLLTGGIMVAFLAANLLYSFGAKRVAGLDVLFISLSFLLRVTGGAKAIEVPISLWILLCTLGLSAYLGLGKRVHELNVMKQDAAAVRKALAGYNPVVTRWAFLATGALSVALYAAYTLSSHAEHSFGTSNLVFTVPLVALGLGRFAQISIRTSTHKSPTEALVTDPVILVSVFGWAAACLYIVYGGR